MSSCSFFHFEDYRLRDGTALFGSTDCGNKPQLLTGTIWVTQTDAYEKVHSLMTLTGLKLLVEASLPRLLPLLCAPISTLAMATPPSV